MGTELRPRQLGFGTLGGTEAAVHAARAFITTQYEKLKFMFKLDFRKAFNCINRGTILNAVKNKLPQYYSFFFTATHRE